ncbi:MAG: enoyl-CoA hydratase/isomerase family protein, partial [Rhodoferax sp.]|nr:enoyl-CoA hydratase/isomerase family protein [Rhodoferax sp.]
RELNQPLAGVSIGYSHHKTVVKSMPNPYAYANSAEHREGIQAFLDKRKPAF